MAYAVNSDSKKRQEGLVRSQNWWMTRWERTLSQWMDETRLAEARRQVHGGYVLDLEVFPGLIVARVREDSPPEVYHVRLLVTTFAEAEWQRVARILHTRQNYAAQLRRGEMPEDIEAIFRAAGLTLLPASLHDISVTCTCSAWLSACKHWPAALYALGERIERDPFLLFALRGRPYERFQQILKTWESGEAAFSTGRAETPEGPAGPMPFPADSEAFWYLDPALETFAPEEPWPQEPSPPEILEDLPFLEDENIKQQLVEVYRRVSQHARALKTLGERHTP